MQEVKGELAATQALLARCRSSFDALMEHYAEHPASANEPEFWHDVQTFVRALSAAQCIHELQRKVRRNTARWS